MAGMDQDAPSVSFVSAGHDVADARLHRLVRACRRRGLTVEVLGLGDPKDGPEGATVRTWARPSIPGRATLALRMAAAASGAVLVAPDPDSLLACWVLGRIRRRAGRRRAVVADVHENYADLLRDRAWATGWLGAGARLMVRGAADIARGADLTIVADDHLAPFTAKDRVVVRNEPDRELIGDVAAPSPTPRAVYVGDVRASRGLFEMIDAVIATSDWTLDIIGEVAAADREALEAALARPESAGRITVHGRRPPRQAWDLARSAWVGFALLHDTPAFREAIPSKLYEYLTLGIVPVVSDLPRQRQLLTELRAGVVVPGTGPDLSREAARVLRQLADAPMDVAAHRAAARERRADGDAPSDYDIAAERIDRLVRAPTG